MKNRKGLSSIVGAVFSIIALATVITYVTYSLNTLEKFNQEVISKNTELSEQNNEKLDVVRSEIANNKFNITVQNTGTLPINVTRLWVTNKTGINQVYKYDLNIPITPGSVATFGQNLGLAAFDTQSYDMKVVTERGNSEEFFINLPSQETLQMQLVASPDTLPDQFTTTLVYQVVNNMTSNNMLLNLQPVISASGTATPTLVSGPIPSSYPTLAQGNIATFVWVYTLSGADATSVTFNATLANAKVGNWVTSTATVKVPLSSLSAGTAVTSTGLGTTLLADNTLILHNETNLTPGGAYQMFTGDADAGNDGKKLMLNQTNPSFFTQNSTNTISIPAGNWIASLKLRSDSVPLSLQGDGESMIFHFEDGDGVNPDNSQGSASRDLQIGTCGQPDWQAGTGPHSSGSYYFNGINNCFKSINTVSASDENDINPEPDTTALWFKTNGQIASDQYLVAWAGSGCPNCDYYRIYLNDTGKVVFRFDTSLGTQTNTCKSQKDYDDDQWYNIVAVRVSNAANPSNADDCELYITALNGTRLETITDFEAYGTHYVDTSGRWYVGSNTTENGNWFKGWIDDIMHWNNKNMTSAEADDLSKTNYGTGAHKITFKLDKTDQNGALLQNINTTSSFAVPFKDGKALPVNDDNAYSVFNFTMYSMPQVILSPGERLNFSMNYVSTSTANWKPFNVNMTIDDANMTPQPSFLDIPMPNATLPSYFIYDNDNWLIVNVTNSGTFGSWLTFAGSRAVFDDISGTISYAGIAQRINDTAIDPNNDSVFLPVGSTVGINYSQPKSSPSSTGVANLIPPGTYKLYLYLQGYDETSQISLRTKYAGLVTVVD